MLRQEINLHRQFTRPITSATSYTWKRYWIFNLLVVLLLTIILIGSFFQTRSQRNEYKTLQVQLIAYQAEFKKLKESFPQLFFSENINESVENLKKQMAAQQKIIEILSRHSPFSEILLGLSRTIIPNVWLTTMTIDKNGEQIVLDGESLGMSRLNEYLKSVEKYKIFVSYTVVVHEVKNKDVNDTNVPLTFEINMAK